LNRREKEQLVIELKETIEKSNSLMVADYRGLTVAEMTDLRQKLKKAQGEFRVAKNTLFKFAAEGTQAEPLLELLTGPNGFAFSYGEPTDVAKALTDYSKDHPKLELKGGVLAGVFMDAKRIETLARLPAREVLLGQAVGAMAGLLRSLLGVLGGVPRSFVGVLYALKEKDANPA